MIDLIAWLFIAWLQFGALVIAVLSSRVKAGPQSASQYLRHTIAWPWVLWVYFITEQEQRWRR